MPQYIVSLTRREEVAESTMAFWFAKPAGFEYRAGQYLVLGLVDPPETDKRSSRRPLSMASAPYEREIMVAMRMRDSAFKRVLKSLPIGAPVTIDGPFGVFDFPIDPQQPAVFLAGGIGATPFRSLALEAAHNHFLNPIYLFYSNRRPEDAAFLGELQELEKKHPPFRLLATMTQMEKSKRPWPGETGYINEAMLRKYLSALEVPMYYIAGPPQMVKAMGKMLSTAGVNPDHIRVEMFSGYQRTNN